MAASGWSDHCSLGQLWCQAWAGPWEMGRQPHTWHESDSCQKRPGTQPPLPSRLGGAGERIQREVRQAPWAISVSWHLVTGKVAPEMQVMEALHSRLWGVVLPTRSHVGPSADPQ